jgi:RimJ/RimL family protein N-acetyltransferase
MPRLTGENIVLREYRKEDLPHINKFANDYDTVKYLSDVFLVNHSMESSEKYLQSITGNISNDSLNYIIAQRETLSYIGQIDLVNINWVTRIGTLGIVIAEKDYLNKGIGTEAIKLILSYAFGRMNLHKVALEVHEFNDRAYKCYKKCGFVQEGVIRECLYRDGKYYNSIKMGILKSEFAL